MDGSARISAIVAMDNQRVIGFRGGIPWHLPDDLKRFAALTTGHVVLMGRKTFDSLPSRFRPLPRRTNVVVSRSAVSHPEFHDVVYCSDPAKFLRDCKAGVFAVPQHAVWVVGGEEVYRTTLEQWDEVRLTLVEGRHQGDTFFPEFEHEFDLASSEPGPNCQYLHYVRK